MPLRFAALLVGLCLLLPGALLGQIDYRNLDRERPVRTEDAYPVERYAFELQAPYRYARERGGLDLHLFTPELEYGLFDNTQVGVAAHLAGADGVSGDMDWGLAGVSAFGFYNVNTESRVLPAFALRADLSAPVGALAGDKARVTFTGIATRSWGLYRVHLNAAHSLGSESGLGRVEQAPRWEYSLAADRAFFRQSVLVIAEVAALRAVKGAPTAVDLALGARYQWTPYTVIDVGLARRLRDVAGPDIAVTVGLSHAFALRGLMPRGPR